jgi:exosortase
MTLASAVVCLFFALHEVWARHPALHFVPLPLAAGVWLLIRDGGLRDLQRPRHPAACRWLAVAHLLLALTSFVLVSPFLAGVALVLAAAAVAAARQPGENQAPAWSLPALALFFIPPPMMLDQQLHQILAGLAARLSQGWLDAMQVLHVVQGTIVATPEKRFFVDDACSGANSLLAAVCVAVVVCSLNRRSLLHALFMMLSAVVISVASNVLRICVVIGGLHHWGLELDQGWPHEAVGFAFFLLDLAMVWSADRGWNFALNWAPAVTHTPPWMRPPVPAAAAAHPWYARISLLIALIGTVSITGPELLALSRPSAVTSGQPLGNLTDEEFQMPKQLSGWLREGDKPLEDSIIGKLGVRNQVWLYRKDGLEAFVAVNFPFLGFHDTRVCYNGQGWQFQKQVDAALPGDREKTVRFLEMNQPTELTRAHLWLSVLDEKGTAQKLNSENPLDHLGKRLWSRWTQPKRGPTTTYVLQVLAIEPQEEETAQQAFTDLLAGARNLLADAISTRTSPSGKESE